MGARMLELLLSAVSTRDYEKVILEPVCEHSGVERELRVRGEIVQAVTSRSTPNTASEVRSTVSSYGS
jgi:hypothetical protein